MVMGSSNYLDARVRGTISPVEVRGLMLQKPDRLVVVDVRNEAVPSIIRGAIHIPEDQIAGRTNELPRRKLIVLYSWNSGCDLAIKATIKLLDAGFDARQLHGGIAGWILLRLPIRNPAVDLRTVKGSPVFCYVGAGL